MNIGRRWALCVGVNDYGAQTKLPNLPYAVNDACLLYETLVDAYSFQGVLLAAPRDVTHSAHPDLASVTAGVGSEGDIIRQINRLRRYIRPHDVFVFFYAGYSLAGPPTALLPYGAEYDKLSTYVMYPTLCGELSALQCRWQALFLSGFDTTFQSVESQAKHDDVVPDDARVVAYTSTRDVAAGPYSPFAQAICDFLRDEISPGEGFAPDQLGDYLTNTRVQRQTRFWPEVPEVRPGKGAFRLQKPSFTLKLQPTYRGRVGEPLHIEVQAQQDQEAHALQWDIKEEIAPPYQIDRRENGDFILHFDTAGEMRFTVEATDTKTQEVVVMTIEVIVEPALDTPLGVSPTPLNLCVQGQDYHAFIPIHGGTPPYQGSITELPPGFAGELRDPAASPDSREWGFAITGSMPATSDFKPVGYNLCINLQDQMGRACQTYKRLFVMDQDVYCHIEGKKFVVGLAINSERSTCIVEMLHDHLQFRLRNPADANIEDIQRMLQKLGQAEGQRQVDEALQLNPGSEVTVDTFYMKKYPVTNAEWQAFLKATDSHERPRHWDIDSPYFPPEDDNLPVVNITYEQIQSYLSWKGTRLPNAWEWELAARGVDGHLFPWGDRFSTAKCNVMDSGRGELTPVDAYDDTYESPTGTRDMVGNAAEWVDHRVLTTYRGQPALAQPFRGGSYLDPCEFALTFKDSRETGIIFGAQENDAIIGQTEFSWVGFRDVVDLDAETHEPQGLVDIPEIQLSTDQPPVPAFSMSRYAVSNLEYFEFIQASSHTPPPDWDKRPEQVFPFSQTDRHLPVVNVSYHDALAFCLWKSRQLGLPVRLPTPEQWQAAVDGGQQNVYPWGNTFDPKKCNGMTSGWGKRLPVFTLREGQSWQGIFNLIGNVWEWTGTPVSRGNQWRIPIRGGMWQMNCQHLVEKAIEGVVTHEPSGLLTSKSPTIGLRYVAPHSQENR